MPYAPTVTLRNGAELPVLGLGTWPLRGAECAAAVRTAIEAGYRLVDTAENYRNEDGVGQGLRDSGLDRSEMFVTTKFNRAWHSVDGVRKAWQASVERLGVEYVDMLMVHWPNPDQGTLRRRRPRAEGAAGRRADPRDRGLELQACPSGARAGRERDRAGREPDPSHSRTRRGPTTRSYDDEHGIVTESYSPIGGSGEDLRSDPLLAEVAARHDKTAAQVALRWHVQQGLVAIPKSADPGRIAQNIDIFDFELTVDEMAAITALDRGEAGLTDSDVFGH